MLTVHRAERAGALATALAGILAQPPADPFTPEVVAVPTRGMERWLTQQLSTRLGVTGGRADGICANVEFPFPRVLVNAALATALGTDPALDPWSAERSVWPLLATVDGALSETWLSALAAHLGETDAAVRNRRFASVRHIAELYDAYGIRRPEMLQAWARGEDTDGAGRALSDDGRWQAELWRRLRRAIGIPSPAERLTEACAAIQRDPQAIDLPERLAVFNLTRLPSSYLRVLDAIAAHREVHLFILHPSPELWERIAGTPPVARRAADPTPAQVENRLLASWGQDSRELQLVLAGSAHSDRHHPVQTRADTLLGRIQDDIRADRPPPGAPLPGQDDGRPRLGRPDRSLQIHACHGRARQVEVMRDAILHLLQDDPTLEPRDVIVMCPDIETIAPLVQAAFGAGRVESRDESRNQPDGEIYIETARPLPDLRVRLADRSLRQTNPVLGTVSALLDLADQRITASQLLDLADREPVRRRFAFDDDDISRLQDWVVDSGIRWGLDAPHREPFKLEVVAANTWQSGLDRILLGVAMSEEDRSLVGGVLPLDDVDSGVIGLAGRMAEFVQRVRSATDALSRSQPIAAWAQAIARAADALTATSDRDSWQRGELQRILADVLADATGAQAADADAPSPAELELADVRALLADHLRGRPTRANFRTGHLTVCTLVPMRSVPHRVVCLLGLDDGEFPRKAPRDGDDLLLRDPHVGDRDPRSEDRQMLLDALMAATERLIITYTGNDERTNLPRPPAVPVAELLDVVERTVRCDRGTARDQIEVRHPLQPFDPRNFTAGALVEERAWSFDHVALGGARALAGARSGREPFLTAPLPGTADRLLELDNLVRFVEHPMRAFLRVRLGISAREYAEDVRDALPVELDALEEWGVGQRLLDGLLAGGTIEECAAAELARGTLPPGALAQPILAKVSRVAEQLAAAASQHGGDVAPRSLDVNVALPGGRILAGTVPGVHGDLLRRASYSRVRPQHRLATWARLLALSASRPDRPFTAVVIGRPESSRSRAQVEVRAMTPPGEGTAGRWEAAIEQLEILVDLYDRGMREPLPIATQASAAYAKAAGEGEDAEGAARFAWESGFKFDKEDRQPEHLLVFGRQLTFAELLGAAPRSDEHGPGWLDSEPSRFGRYARRLWGGLLDYETRDAR